MTEIYTDRDEIVRLIAYPIFVELMLAEEWDAKSADPGWDIFDSIWEGRESLSPASPAARAIQVAGKAFLSLFPRPSEASLTDFAYRISVVRLAPLEVVKK